MSPTGPETDSADDAPPPLEPDTSDHFGRDSTYESQSLSSLTASVTSSVFKYREEYGRTFHSYKEGQYQFPNDEPELDRLDLQHHLLIKLLGDKLFLAPVSDSPQNVLDVGTGTGIWAIEFADQYPSASVIGTDLSPVQPVWVPANVRFEMDDSNDTWTHSCKFDFIHCRQLHCAIEEKRLFRQALEALKPGGWMEFKETAIPLLSDDGTLDDTALLKWSDGMMKVGSMLGSSWDNPLQYRTWMEEAGFVNVQERIFPLPTNSWPKDEEMKLIGEWETVNFQEGLQGFSVMLWTKLLGWEADKLDVFLAEVRKDIQDRRIHAYLRVVCVIGQKPE